jgi:hypothetical protein
MTNLSRVQRTVQREVREATKELLGLLKDWQAIDLVQQNGGRQDQYERAYAELCKQRDLVLQDLL